MTGRPNCGCRSRWGGRCPRYAIVFGGDGRGYCAQHARIHGVFSFPGWERVDGMARDRRTVVA
jgi:hypothetical protein